MNIRKECSCGGNNENCYRCFGRGYYYADDFKPLTTSLSTARGKGVSYLVCPYCKDTVTKSHIKKCKFNTDKSVQEKQPVKDAETGRVNIECPYCGIHVSNLKRHMDIVHSS